MEQTHSTSGLPKSLHSTTR